MNNMKYSLQVQRDSTYNKITSEEIANGVYDRVFFDGVSRLALVDTLSGMVFAGMVENL